MFQIIPVIFEDGVFKPLRKMRLREHQKLSIRLDTRRKKNKALRETTEIRSDRGQLKRIARALAHVRQGRLLTHKDVFGHPQPNM